MACEVDVLSPRIKKPVPGSSTAVGYLSLIHTCQKALKLVGIKLDGAVVAELHEHRHDNGTMRMRKVDTLLVQSKETLEFKPGGYHIMIFNWPNGSDSANGAPTEIEGRLLFQSGEIKTVKFEVVDW